jgi:hypothetical protein
MQIPMFSKTVKARVISMMIFVKALTICYMSLLHTPAEGAGTSHDTYAKPDRSNGQS